MTTAFWTAITALCSSVASLLTWYVHSRTGSHANDSRKGDQ